MTTNYGDVGASTTLYVYFTTSNAAGGAVAPSTAFEAGDLLLYKNGSATERSSTSGWTITSPFDSKTGLHVLAIDLSDNTDASFYAVGARYHLVLSPDTETVDSQTVIAVVATFRIVPAQVHAALVDGTEYLQTDSFKVIWAVSSGTLTVKKVDGTTTLYTRTLTTDAAAVPVTASA